MAPRMYLAIDANLTSAPVIEALGEAHGPDGPFLFVSLLCTAKLQGNDGEVRTTRRKLADDTFVGDRDKVDTIIEHAIQLGALERVEVSDRMIHVRLPRWNEWQTRGRAAERKAAQRAREEAAAAANGGDPFEVLP